MSSENTDGKRSQSRKRVAEPVDPENFNLRRRLQQIHNAKEKVPETIREERKRVVEDPRDPGITQETYRELVANAVLNFIIEVEPLMQNEGVEGTDIWDDEDVVTIGDVEYTLKELVEQNGYLKIEDSEGPMPIWASRQAYRATNRFLASAGLGVKLDEKMPSEEGFDSTNL
jgi:hypothetical protein